MPSPPFRTALVTGASSGLGRGLALSLARKGCELVLVARREALLQELAGEVEAAGGCAHVRPLDCGDAEAVVQCVREADAELGGLELVVANAGIGRARPASKLEPEEVVDVLRVNTLGACATLIAAVQPMLARGGGTLVAMSSQASRRGLPAAGSYSASKAALSTFCETLRIDLAHKGIRVVDVRPGFVRTAMTEGNQHPMPCMWELDRATEYILRGIERGTPVLSFPWQMTLTMGLGRLLPEWLWRALARRALSG